jgi:putative phosphoesterase
MTDPGAFMRLGILSDTHDQLDRTRFAVQLLQDQGAEGLVHCGDLTGHKIVTACAVLPCYFVFGNNDADNVPALRRAIVNAGAVCLEWGGEVVLAGKRVAVVHGHMGTDVRRLFDTRPDYLLSGHSHTAADRRYGPTRRINPGALYRASEYTVALLDLETDELQFLNVPRPGAV